MADEQRALTSVPRWNRQEVNRYLLPVLRFVDGERDGVTEDVARLAVSTCQAAYEQLSRVWRTADTDTLDRWFGQVFCEDELLDAAFDFIDEVVGGGHRNVPLSYDKHAYFASMFRITDGGVTVDLARPFEQYYLCDEAFSKDYLHRRIGLGEECQAMIRQYAPYYNRIRAWYRDNGEEQSGVSHEYVAYMALYDDFRERLHYEDEIADSRRALEYERGGLGWFHRDRKKEIDAELLALEWRECRRRLDDANEKYEAYEAQFAADRDAWLKELEHAPVTAFGRKKELKQRLAELDARLVAYRQELRVDELSQEYQNILRKGPASWKQTEK